MVDFGEKAPRFGRPFSLLFTENRRFFFTRALRIRRRRGILTGYIVQPQKAELPSAAHAIIERDGIDDG